VPQPPRAALPAPLPAYGPHDRFGRRVHELTFVGQAQEALRLLERYEPVVRLLGDRITLGFLIQGRMYALRASGRREEALAAAGELIELHRAAGARSAQAKAYADLASLLLDVGRLDEGLQALARSEALLEGRPSGDRRAASARSSLAEAARTAGLYEVADVHAQASIEALARLGDDVARFSEMQLGPLLLEWGMGLEHVGRVEDARGRYARSAEISAQWDSAESRLESTEDSRWSRVLLAVAHAKLGRPRLARDLVEDLVPVLRRDGQEQVALLAHLAYGLALRGLGDLAGAARELVAATELCTDATEATRLAILYEREVTDSMAHPGPARGRASAALRAHAEALWRLRGQRLAMLRQARRREELEAERALHRRAATEDPLTGLGNRRRFDQMLGDIDRRGPGSAEPVSLILVDVDNFKAVNDTFSHPIGDAVLQRVARELRRQCRSEDVAVRHGGDEFAVFLRTDLATARGVAERIHGSLHFMAWHEIAVGLRVTTSTGVATLRPGMTGRDLFDAADARLYEAKNGGRNQIAA